MHIILLLVLLTSFLAQPAFAGCDVPLDSHLNYVVFEAPKGASLWKYRTPDLPWETYRAEATRANCLSDPDLVQVGQILVLPTSVKKLPAGSEVSRIPVPVPAANTDAGPNHRILLAVNPAAHIWYLGSASAYVIGRLTWSSGVLKVVAAGNISLQQKQIGRLEPRDIGSSRDPVPLIDQVVRNSGVIPSELLVPEELKAIFLPSVRFTLGGFIVDSNYLSAWQIYWENWRHAIKLVKQGVSPYLQGLILVLFTIAMILIVGRSLIEAAGFTIRSRQVLVQGHLLPEVRHSSMGVRLQRNVRRMVRSVWSRSSGPTQKVEEPTKVNGPAVTTIIYYSDSSGLLLSYDPGTFHILRRLSVWVSGGESKGSFFSVYLKGEPWVSGTRAKDTLGEDIFELLRDRLRRWGPISTTEEPLNTKRAA